MVGESSISNALECVKGRRTSVIGLSSYFANIALEKEKRDL